MQRPAEKELADVGLLRALPSSGGPLTSEEKLREAGAIEALTLDIGTFAREFALSAPANEDDGLTSVDALRRTPCPLGSPVLWRLRRCASDRPNSSGQTVLD